MKNRILTLVVVLLTTLTFAQNQKVQSIIYKQQYTIAERDAMTLGVNDRKQIYVVDTGVNEVQIWNGDSWETLGGDNLGNHTLTEDLMVNNHNIDSDDDLSFQIDIDNNDTTSKFLFSTNGGTRNLLNLDELGYATFGVQDTNFAWIRLYGDNANQSGGLQIFNGANQDTNIDSYYWSTVNGNLTLIANGGTNGSSTPVFTVNSDNLQTGFGNYEFPRADGTAGQILKTNGSGQLTWQDASGGSSTALETTYDNSNSNIPDTNVKEALDYLDTKTDFRGDLAIADTPATDGYYFATETGTYTNAGSVVTDLTQGLNIIIKEGVNYSLITIPVNYIPNGAIAQGDTAGVSGDVVSDYLNANESFLSKTSNILGGLNDLNGRLGYWISNASATIQVNGTNDAVQVTTTNNTYSGIRINDVVKLNTYYKFVFYLELISGTANDLYVATLPSALGNRVQITPVLGEKIKVEGIIKSHSSQNDFYICTINSSSGSMVFEVSDIKLYEPTEFMKLKELQLFTDTLTENPSFVIEEEVGGQGNLKITCSNTFLELGSSAIFDNTSATRPTYGLLWNPVIDLTGGNKVAYIKQSELKPNEQVTIHYGGYNSAVTNAALLDPDVKILAQIGSRGKLKDANGILIDYIKDNVTHSRLTTIENTNPQAAKADSEAALMYARGLEEKDYVTVNKFGILGGGQSNFEGFVDFVDLSDSITNPNVNAKIWNYETDAFQNFEIGVNAGTWDNDQTRHGFTAFLYKQIATSIGDDFYCVTGSKGGTPIYASDISPSSTTLYSFQPKFELQPNGINYNITNIWEQRIREAKAYATTNTINIDYKVVIWNQGESDATPARSPYYYQNLKNLIAYVRGVLKKPDLVWIIATQHPSSTGYNATVDSAQRAIANEDNNVYLVDASLIDWTHIGDGLHTDNAFNERLANEYYLIMQDLFPDYFVTDASVDFTTDLLPELDIFGFVNTSGGVNDGATTFLRSDFIAAVPGDQFDIDVVGNTGLFVVSYYDSSQVYISGSGQSVSANTQPDAIYNQISTAPAGTAYVRFSMANPATNSAALGYNASVRKL